MCMHVQDVNPRQHRCFELLRTIPCAANNPVRSTCACGHYAVGVLMHRADVSHRRPCKCSAQAAVNPRPRVVGEDVLHAGDVGYAPRGMPHYFKNVGCTDAFVLIIFDAGTFNTIDVTHVTADLPAQV